MAYAIKWWKTCTTVQCAIYCAGVTLHDFGVLKTLNFKQLTCHTCFGPPTCKTLVRSKINLQRFSKLQITGSLTRTFILLNQQTKTAEEAPGTPLCRDLRDFSQWCYIRMVDVCRLNSSRWHGTDYILFSKTLFEKYEPKITRCPAAAYIWKDQQSHGGQVSSFCLCNC